MAPLITIFGCLFFTIKYYIDKYNIAYVYPKEYNGQGRLYKSIIKYQIFGMWFSEIIMFGIFMAVFGKKYSFMCLVIVLFQIGLYIFKLFGDICKTDKFKKWLASNYASVEEEAEFLKEYQYLLSDETVSERDTVV